MGQIRVFIEKGRWVADFSESTGANEFRRVMGKDVMPLPWPYYTDFLTVRDDLEKRNPGDEVVRDFQFDKSNEFLGHIEIEELPPLPKKKRGNGGDEGFKGVK